MATSCTPVSDWLLWPYRPYFQTACFLAGCLEREHWLNVEDLYAHGLRMSAAWLGLARDERFSRTRESRSDGGARMQSSARRAWPTLRGGWAAPGGPT
jgi:hypothetical protein